MVNLSNEDFLVEDSERICRMVIARHEKVSWEEAIEMEEGKRGAGGFGHTEKINQHSSFKELKLILKN